VSVSRFGHVVPLFYVDRGASYSSFFIPGVWQVAFILDKRKALIRRWVIYMLLMELDEW
jgi:hypothetical protein